MVLLMRKLWLFLGLLAASGLSASPAVAVSVGFEASEGYSWVPCVRLVDPDSRDGPAAHSRAAPTTIPATRKSPIPRLTLARTRGTTRAAMEARARALPSRRS